MTDLILDKPPEGGLVDEATRDYLDSRLKDTITTLTETLENKHGETRMYVDNAITALVTEREQARNAERAAIDAQLTQRPTREDVRAMIQVSVDEAAKTFATMVNTTIAPLTIEMAGIKAAVGVRLADRDDGLTRLERNLNLLGQQTAHQIQYKRKRIDKVERQNLLLRGRLQEITHDLYGDPNAPDAQPSLQATLHRMDTLIVGLRDEIAGQRRERDADLLRLSRVEAFIATAEAEKKARIERWQKAGAKGLALIREAPKWFQFAMMLAGITTGGLSLTAALLLLWQMLSGAQ